MVGLYFLQVCLAIVCTIVLAICFCHMSASLLPIGENSINLSYLQVQLSIPQSPVVGSAKTFMSEQVYACCGLDVVLAPFQLLVFLSWIQLTIHGCCAKSLQVHGQQAMDCCSRGACRCMFFCLPYVCIYVIPAALFFALARLECSLSCLLRDPGNK